MDIITLVGKGVPQANVRSYQFTRLVEELCWLPNELFFCCFIYHEVYLKTGSV